MVARYSISAKVKTHVNLTWSMLRPQEGLFSVHTVEKGNGSATKTLKHKEYVQSSDEVNVSFFDETYTLGSIKV